MTTAESINLRASRKCACGVPKVRGTAFCGTCYHALTDQLRNGLWMRIGKGFEAAYEAALAYLHTTWIYKDRPSGQ